MRPICFKSKILYFLSAILLWGYNIGFAQQTAIQAENSKVLYTGLDNPVEIVMTQKPCASVVAKATHGSLTREGKSCQYTYRNDRCHITHEQFLVGYTRRSDTIWTDTLHFRVLIPEPPVPFISHRLYGPITPEKLLESPFVNLNFKNFHINGVYFYVGSYSVDIFRGDSLIFRQTDIQGKEYSQALKAMIQKAETGDNYRFYDILCSNCRCWTIPPPLELSIIQQN